MRRRPEEIINVLAQDGDDYSDLDIVNVVSKQLKDADGYINNVLQRRKDPLTEDERASESESGANGPHRGLALGTTRGEGVENAKGAERLDWSSEDDSEDAYQQFKDRRKKRRKRAAESARPSKNQKAEPKTQISRSTRRGETVVGKRAPTRQAKRKQTSWKSARDTGDETDRDDRLDDEHLPEYVKDRKTKFEAARTRLGNAGLKLPPSYDDVYFSDEEHLEDLQEKPVLPTIKPCGPYKDIPLDYSGGIIPAPIAQWLRNYQIQGVEFLHELFVWQRGGILGDDMGLGKTIQVISFLTAAFGKTGDERDAKRMRKTRRKDDRWYPKILIVCPGTLMANWKSELSRWGWWQVEIYHGTEEQKLSTMQAAQNGRVEIVITTYTTYRNHKSAINTIDWDCVVADECHTIKSRSSEITRAMNDVNALCRIGLTGTAIQNNYDELWTLLNWSNPGRFGSLASWQHSISTPLALGQAHDATSYQLGLARRTAHKLVTNLLPQFFRRRMKSLIAAQLPKKSDRVVFCPLTDTQADAYANYVDSELVNIVRTASDFCGCGSGKKSGWCCNANTPEYGKWQNHVFPLIVTLQKLSNHLALLIPSSQDPLEKQGKDLNNLQIALPSGWRSLSSKMDNILNFANQEFCGKWKILKKLLAFWHTNGDKVLVFSHSVRLLKMLHVLFTSSTSYNVSYLDGGMSYEDRAAVVDDFNANPDQFVFLISTRAGGVGLNITSANKVVVVDPNWNPSHDLQAQDRAYRIGQTRDVEVFRLISAGTIEEVVYARQIYKQQQANIGYTASSERRYFTGVQNNKEKKGEIFGLKNLFSFQNEGVVLQEIVNKTNIAESRIGVVVGDIDMSQVTDEEVSVKFEDEDAAMRELAELITGGVEERTKKHTVQTDPVQAILSSAGVKYTHDNAEVIGTSKAETTLSRKAAENTTSIDGQDIPIFDAASHENFTDSSGKIVRWKFRPPEEIRKRQFCSMAATFGFATATEFALVVEGWTQEQRRDCLEKFYRARRQGLLATGALVNSSEAKVNGDGDTEDEL